MTNKFVKLFLLYEIFFSTIFFQLSVLENQTCENGSG